MNKGKRKRGKIITFDKSALKEICKGLNIPYDKDIIAFTRKGIYKKKDILDLINEPFNF